MNTPYFPVWRSKLAALGRRAGHYGSAAEVENEFARCLPRHLLVPSAQGIGSRRRAFTRKRTF